MVSGPAPTPVRVARSDRHHRRSFTMQDLAKAAAGERTLPDGSPAPLRAVPFHYTQTDSFASLLAGLGASLLVSTYQANKLLVARAEGGGLSMLVRTFDQPMGLAVDARRLMIGTRDRIWALRNAPDIAPR